MQRRGFLGAMLAAGVAPAFVGSKILMPVKTISSPYDALASNYVLGMQNSMYLAASEMLRILNSSLKLSTIAERDYVRAWEPERTIVVRRPRQLLART
jgi:hypothetical protein